MGALTVWHRLFRIWPCWHQRLYSQKVGVMPKEGWARLCKPILLLVWQWQRPWGLFSRDSRQLFTACHSNILLNINCNEYILSVSGIVQSNPCQSLPASEFLTDRSLTPTHTPPTPRGGRFSQTPASRSLLPSPYLHLSRGDVYHSSRLAFPSLYLKIKQQK